MNTYKDGLRAIIDRAIWTSGPIIEALEDIERLETKNAALKKARGAAVEDMKRMDRHIATSADPCAALCQVCKYKPQAGGECKRCDIHDNSAFEWRGHKDGEEGVDRA